MLVFGLKKKPFYFYVQEREEEEDDKEEQRRIEAELAEKLEGAFDDLDLEVNIDKLIFKYPSPPPFFIGKFIVLYCFL